jgi:ferredoxin
LLTCSQVEEVKGEPGNFRVKITQSPRHVDMESCTGCGDCGRTVLDENSPAKEAHGLFWVDRVRIDESLCIHCGDCVKACKEHNPEKQAMTNIVVQRLQEATRRLEPGLEPLTSGVGPDTGKPILLQQMFLKSAEQRKTFWDEQFRKCVKCYGCVDNCPVYEARPDGFDLSEDIPRGQIPPPYPLFHFLRGYNVWDTCVGCGECEKTCPSGIPLKTWQDMIAFLSPELVFDMAPGLDENTKEKILALVEGRKGGLHNAA